LLELGLGSRCGSLKAEWKKEMALDAKTRETEKKNIRFAEGQRLDNEMKGLEEALPFWLVKQAVEYYKSVAGSNPKFCANIVPPSTISQESLILAILGNQNKTVDSNDVTSAIEKGVWRRGA
jgi:hypothetical protein